LRARLEDMITDLSCRMQWLKSYVRLDMIRCMVRDH